VKEGIAAFLEKRPARFDDQVSAAMPPLSPWLDDPAYGSQPVPGKEPSRGSTG
jgi:hypothetical protein